MKKQILTYLKAVLLAIAIVVGLSGIQAAWSPPVAGTVPPNNNPAVPVNVGSSLQIKSGIFQASSLVANRVGVGGLPDASDALLNVAGAIKLADQTITCNATNAGALKYLPSGSMQFCNGTAWTPLGGTTGDNLGNHTATTNLDMGANSIVNVANFTARNGSSNIDMTGGGINRVRFLGITDNSGASNSTQLRSNGGAIYFGYNGLDYNGVELATSLAFAQDQMRSPKYCITTASDATVNCVTSLSSMPPVCTGNNALHWDGSSWSCDAIASLGMGGQTWTDVKASRTVGGVYTNSTSRPIDVFVRAQSASGGVSVIITVDGIQAAMSRDNGASASTIGASAIVQPGSSYVVTLGGTSPTVNAWSELR